MIDAKTITVLVLLFFNPLKQGKEANKLTISKEMGSRLDWKDGSVVVSGSGCWLEKAGERK